MAVITQHQMARITAVHDTAVHDTAVQPPSSCLAGKLALRSVSYASVAGEKSATQTCYTSSSARVWFAILHM